MSTQIFINLPVADLPRSVAFYQGLGYTLNPEWTDETAACIIVSEHIHVMLLTHAKFRQFTPREICDTQKATQVLLCLSCESREALDALVAKATAHGGTLYAEPTDHGFMYQHSFTDPDGHQWELAYMASAPA